MDWIRAILDVINNVHDGIIQILRMFGLSPSDKTLHFVIVGVLGVLLYGCVHFVFKRAAKLSIHILSFIFTATVVGLLVGMLELQQRILGRGVMDYEDAVAGMAGFLAMMAGLALVAGLIKGFKYLMGYTRGKKDV